MVIYCNFVACVTSMHYLHHSPLSTCLLKHADPYEQYHVSVSVIFQCVLVCLWCSWHLKPIVCVFCIIWCVQCNINSSGPAQIAWCSFIFWLVVLDHLCWTFSVICQWNLVHLWCSWCQFLLACVFDIWHHLMSAIFC